MNRDEFLVAYTNTVRQACNCFEKARREGLLALLLDFPEVENKADSRDIFCYGIQLVVDGTDANIIDKILSNIINQEKDDYTRLLKTIQKEAILAIQGGCNSRLLMCLMNSYTDMSLKEDKAYQANSKD